MAAPPRRGAGVRRLAIRVLPLLLGVAASPALAQSPGPFVVFPPVVLTMANTRHGTTDFGLGLGLAVGWTFSSNRSLVLVGDGSLMNIDRDGEGYFLGQMGLLLRQRVGAWGTRPLYAAVGPITWEGDNSGIGAMGSLDLDAIWPNGRRVLASLDLMYFAPAMWHGMNPTTGLPNPTDRDPRLALRLRLGPLLEMRERR
jgi:hypothetical protein